MKIIYISIADFPSKKANSIHIMKMCQAFALNNHQITLIAPKQKNEDINSQDIYNYYGVKNIFKIFQFSIPNLILNISWLIYSIKILITIKKHKPDIVFGRFLLGCLFTSLSGFNTILEVHQPIPKKINFFPCF
ncbi:MAG: hypothetical protein MZV70_76555 [Desulfobacterales bacterium]|nr:hypothetical protein [Desulfobacterales bacterium]